MPRVNHRDRFEFARAAGTVFNLPAGLWLIVCPWVLGYTTREDVWSSVIFGIPIAAWRHTGSARVTQGCPGSTCPGRFRDRVAGVSRPYRTTSSIIVGIVVAAVALIAASGERSGAGTIP